MYEQFDSATYLKHRSDLIVRLHAINISQAECLYFKETMYSILSQTVFFYLEDYALYLAFYEKFGVKANSEQVIHIGIKSVQNFVSFWDHLGFGLSTVFHLKLTERESYFDVVATELLKGSNDKQFLADLSELRRLFSALGFLRKEYRNPITHRYHECFIERNNNDTIKNKVLKLNEALSLGYQNMMAAMVIYLRIMKDYAPNDEYGSYLKESIRKKR